jgi:hypothetical protein
MPLTFFEFAALALLAHIAYLLVHQAIAGPQDAPGVQHYRSMVIMFTVFSVIHTAFLFCVIWLAFTGLNWLFSAL